ncbi:M48 family metalloprotease [Sphingomonas lenta]|uniref:M48 family metalloprotease n=1 Tax=Sphingomonas lenta TaxID=1141887 RepID=UPI0015950404|nr:M48 family metalloprotease [Sphingomonas lenta]
MLAAATALLLASCGGPAPEAGPVTVSDEDRAAGAEQHPRLLAEFGGAYAGPEAAYVAQVGGRVAAAAGLEGSCTFTLVNSDVVNAFAVPGCYIYVTRGLFAIVGSEAELASVLGHEVGHIVGRHSQRQGRRSVWRQLGVLAVSLTGSERLTRLAGQAAQYFGLRYSRRQEYESDDLGLRYLREAGYDPYAAADMLASLQRNEQFMNATGGRDEAKSIPEWALSHPLTGNRVARAREAAEATGLQDDQLPEREEAYLGQVDGLLYGDDPEQGFVLGRRFAHPEMRIAFEAPQGFTLTNSPRAIYLSGPGGVRGEFGGGAMPEGGLDAYAQSLAAHIAGNAQGEVAGARRTVVNGVPAVLLDLRVQGRSGVVPIRIAAYEGGGGQAYHFLTLSPPDADAGTAIEALFGSFRLLSAAEAASLRPRVIRTVAAPAGATLDTLAARMAGGDGRALFLLLNGRSADQPIRPGERVKVVAYADAR